MLPLKALVRLIQRVIASLASICMHLGDAICFYATPSLYVDSTKTFLSRLEEHFLKFAPEESHIVATRFTLPNP